MTISPQSKKKYDHRLRKLVHETGDISIALRLGVPRSTASAWRKTPPREVITRESFDLSDIQVQSRIQALELQVGTLGAIVTLLLVLVRIAGARLSGERLAEGEDKDKVLRAIERAVRVLPLRSVLRILGLGSSRYHAWTRSRTKGCPLDDRSSCPKTHPAQLLPEDLRTMRDLATSADYRHVPTSTLAILAQRLGKIFASPSTWLRHVRERGWRRPRKRVHPAKPTEGIRTNKPDGLWHIDGMGTAGESQLKGWRPVSWSKEQADQSLRRPEERGDGKTDMGLYRKAGISLPMGSARLHQPADTRLASRLTVIRRQKCRMS